MTIHKDFGPLPTPKATTTFRAWKVHELTDAISRKGDRHIIIPTFQRNFVWNKKQRTDLINSIRSGFPIGCILLYHAGFEHNIQHLQLVDGLQRSVTLVKYLDAVFAHSDDLILESSILAPLYDKFSNASATAADVQFITSTFRDWLRSRESFDATAGYSNVDLWLYLEKKFRPNCTPAPDAVFMAQLQQLLDSLKQQLDIASFEVPVIEFSGAPDHLPDIFDRLNTGGTKLAKYDILAASWNDKHVSIVSPDLIEAVKQKYRDLLFLGMELEAADYGRFEDFNHEHKFLLFEYVFSAGRCLKDKFPKLFGKSREKTTEVDSLGFTLFTLCAGLKISELAKFAPYIEGIDDTSAHYQAVRLAVAFVQDAVAPCINFPIEREPLKKLAHTEFQICFLVSSVFHLMFSDALSPKADWQAGKDEVAANVRQWYVYDGLRKHWRNAGDSKSYNAMKALTILQNVPFDSMIAALDSWFRESLQSQSRDLDPVSRCVIKTVASSKLKTMPSAEGAKFAIRQLLTADEVRNSGVSAANPVNIVLVNPDSERTFDPCGLSGHRPSRDQAIMEFFEFRYAALKQRLLGILYGSNDPE